MHDAKKETVRIKKYLFVGVTAFLLEYGTFVVLDLFFGSQLIIAQSVSFLVGLTTSYTGNRFMTFYEGSNSHNALRTHTQILSFLVLGVVNLIISNLVLHYLVEGLGILPLFAKIAVMFSVAAWNYLVFSKFIFKKV